MIEERTILKNAGLKATLPRLTLVRALSKSAAPITAEELSIRTKKDGGDLATIYRTLTSFEKAGIIRRIDLRQGAASYELNAGHHHHIVCTDCGDVEDFELCDMDRLTQKIANSAKKFKSVSQHSLELFGLCTACAK